MPRVTIPEAARLLKVSQQTIRRRLDDGKLTAEKEPTPQGFKWWVLIPDEMVQAAASEPGQGRIGGGREAELLQQIADLKADKAALLDLFRRSQQLHAEALQKLPQLTSGAATSDAGDVTPIEHAATSQPVNVDDQKVTPRRRRWLFIK